MAQPVLLTTMTDVINRALDRWYEHRPRIERAAALLILDHVRRTAPGEYAVKSQTAPGQSYYVTPESCACKDRDAHQDRACKHMMAVRLLEIAEERQRRIDAADQFPLLTVAEMGRLSALKKRYQGVEV